MAAPIGKEATPFKVLLLSLEAIARKLDANEISPSGLILSAVGSQLISVKRSEHKIASTITREMRIMGMKQEFLRLFDVTFVAVEVAMILIFLHLLDQNWLLKGGVSFLFDDQ